MDKKIKENLIYYKIIISNKATLTGRFLLQKKGNIMKLYDLLQIGFFLGAFYWLSTGIIEQYLFGWG